MHTAIVIPCLNEERTIGPTARSLGFGLGAAATPADATLILVDNGSKDQTRAVLEQLRSTSRVGSVLITQEAERGYVPPRHRGVLVARDFARRHGIDPSALLILQADADTKYELGFVEAMRAAGEAAGENTLLEGGIHPPHRFLDGHPGFQHLADAVDASVAPFSVADADDVVIDDKVSGFTLSTYLAWGGHRRDHTSLGDELHAETARLFLRGLSLGGRKVRVAGAFAQPSRRKILHNPIRHFVTAGFPREHRWWRKWSSAYHGPRDLGAFEGPEAERHLEAAIAGRVAHVLGLFHVLPVYVGRRLGRDVRAPASAPVLEEMVDDLERASVPEWDIQVPLLFDRLLSMVDERSRDLQICRACVG